MNLTLLSDCELESAYNVNFIGPAAPSAALHATWYSFDFAISNFGAPFKVYIGFSLPTSDPETLPVPFRRTLL